MVNDSAPRLSRVGHMNSSQSTLSCVSIIAPYSLFSPDAPVQNSINYGQTTPVWSTRRQKSSLHPSLTNNHAHPSSSTITAPLSFANGHHPVLVRTPTPPTTTIMGTTT